MEGKPRMTDNLKEMSQESARVLGLDISGDLGMEDLRSSMPITSEKQLAELQKTIADMQLQLASQRNDTRQNIVTSIFGLVAAVIIGSGTMVGFAAFYPGANSELIMSWTQVTLITLSSFGNIALGFYFGSKVSGKK